MNLMIKKVAVALILSTMLLASLGGTVAHADTGDTGQSGVTAGIRPVSPEEFTGRVNDMLDKMYVAASPVTDAVAMVMLAAAGIAALFILFSGMKLFQKVVGAVLCAGLGLLLFYGAPYFVGMVKGIAQYATR